VEVPFELSEQRIAQRWQESYEEALDQKPGKNQLGGRWVPSEYARDVFSGPDGRTRPEAAAQRLANECSAVTRLSRYRTVLDAAGTPVGPTLEAELVRTAKDKPLIPATSTQDAKAAAARDFAKGQFRPARPQQKPAATRILPVRDPSKNPGKDLGSGPTVGR
jgi:hypothetical protein